RCDRVPQPPCPRPRLRGAAATTRRGPRSGCARMTGTPMTRARFLRLGLGAIAGAWLGARAPAARASAAGYDFWFTRLKYDSGDWDVDERMPANHITALIDYP